MFVGCFNHRNAVAVTCGEMQRFASVVAIHAGLLLGLTSWSPRFGNAQATDDMKNTLLLHNVYRCMHGVPLLEWDDAVAANAQKWADNGQYKHSSSQDRVVDGVQLGENLAWGYPTRSGISSTKAWYDEISLTEGGKGLVTTFSAAIGHYTQVVWKATTRLGCAVGKAVVSTKQGPKEGDYIVCQYGSAGNYQGQFSANVLAPTESLATCKQKVGYSGDVTVPGTASGESTGGSSGGSSPGDSPDPTAKLPSSCVPNFKLPTGGLCVYGNLHCQSKFCCPRLRVCLPDSGGRVSSNDVKVPANQQKSILDTIFLGAGTCEPWDDRQACMQTSEGEPLSTWNQSKCKCKQFYMDHYNAGTWVSLNTHEGFKCDSTTAEGANAVPIASVATKLVSYGVGGAVLLTSVLALVR